MSEKHVNLIVECALTVADPPADRRRRVYANLGAISKTPDCVEVSPWTK